MIMLGCDIFTSCKALKISKTNFSLALLKFKIFFLLFLIFIFVKLYISAATFFLVFSLYNRLMERVSLIHGSRPIVIVAPHAYCGDDFNTDIIATSIAENMKCSAIINHGWQKSDYYDFDKDLANCNNIDHMKDVVKDEFLDPLLRLTGKALKNNGKVLVVFIHGVSNFVRKAAETSDLDIILGYGAGIKPSYTCTMGMKDFIIFDLRRHGLYCFEGKPKGKYSAHSRNNMNQYWRQHELNFAVESIQLEIVRDLRDDAVISRITGEYLADTLQHALSNRFWKGPTAFRTSSI